MTAEIGMLRLRLDCFFWVINENSDKPKLKLWAILSEIMHNQCILFSWLFDLSSFQLNIAIMLHIKMLHNKESKIHSNAKFR